MRNKSHTCNMCATADEAHSKRHNEIADRLRDTYDIWGEDWPIVAVEESERKQARTCEDDELVRNDYGNLFACALLTLGRTKTTAAKV
jgi:molybdopterin-biosynthesis enzyme MoeA-like protein